MHLIKEKLDIDEGLNRKIKNILMFLRIDKDIINGNLINIPKTNIVYIEPHKLSINGINYLFFNECDKVYINTLGESIPINELQEYIKLHKS